jgi:hypothetical protein
METIHNNGAIQFAAMKHIDTVRFRVFMLYRVYLPSSSWILSTMLALIALTVRMSVRVSEVIARASPIFFPDLL